MKTAAFYTLGCKVNQYETEAMEELFRAEGYEIGDFSSAADIYIINTCTVTGMSDRKSRQMISRARKANPSALICVTGCYAQTAPAEVLAIDGVNLVLGTDRRKDIVKIAESLTPGERRSAVGNIMDVHKFEEMSIETYSERTRAFIKIQEGCSQFCSYCIIPYARGPVRSRGEKEILKEIERLAAGGFCEVVLTGIHVASYGTDTDTSLEELLHKVNAVDGIERIRLSSIEPMTLSAELVENIKDCDKLCPHFHLSLQSGCDETLKRMNRHYTAKQYYEVVSSLRANFDNPAITTDIMVGFPGETDSEFEQTAEFVKKAAFADAHIFKYSPRKGTPAAKKPQIDPKIKDKRSKIIEKITAVSRNAFLESMLGRTETVLFEQRMKPDRAYFEGKTANYVTVAVKTDEELSGQMRNVRLDTISDGAIKGILV